MLRYLACAWANQFVRLGYLLTLFGIWGVLLPGGIVGYGLIAVGLILLWTTGFGKPTFTAYLITTKRLNRNGKISPLLTKLIVDGGYCVTVGAQLAIVDYFKRSQRARPG